jgi:hypothetical protein
LISGVGSAVGLLELVTETVVEVETGMELVEVGTVTSEQVAPPVKVPHVPDKSLALLKSSV